MIVKNVHHAQTLLLQALWLLRNNHNKMQTIEDNIIAAHNLLNTPTGTTIMPDEVKNAADNA